MNVIHLAKEVIKFFLAHRLGVALLGCPVLMDDVIFSTPQQRLGFIGRPKSRWPNVPQPDGPEVIARPVAEGKHRVILPPLPVVSTA